MLPASQLSKPACCQSSLRVYLYQATHAEVANQRSCPKRNIVGSPDLGSTKLQMLSKRNAESIVFLSLSKLPRCYVCRSAEVRLAMKSLHCQSKLQRVYSVIQKQEEAIHIQPRPTPHMLMRTLQNSDIFCASSAKSNGGATKGNTRGGSRVNREENKIKFRRAYQEQWSSLPLRLIDPRVMVVYHSNHDIPTSKIELCHGCTCRKSTPVVQRIKCS